jgi:phage shock protein A
MRNWALFAVAAIVLANTGPVFGLKHETLQDLISQAKSAKPEDRPKLYLEIAGRQLKSADQLYSQGKAAAARAAVGDVVSYSEKATQDVIERGKKLKHVEISVRKMADRLRDIKRTLDFVDQAPVQQAIDKLEAMRTRLLSAMFGNKD